MEQEKPIQQQEISTQLKERSEVTETPTKIKES